MELLMGISIKYARARSRYRKRFPELKTLDGFDRTNPERCFESASEAEGAGYREALR
jgi:hypothetical protein